MNSALFNYHSAFIIPHKTTPSFRNASRVKTSRDRLTRSLRRCPGCRTACLQQCSLNLVCFSVSDIKIQLLSQLRLLFYFITPNFVRGYYKFDCFRSRAFRSAIALKFIITTGKARRKNAKTI